MKIAITGASGKTGSRITEEAVKKGIKVKQIVRKKSKLPENLKNRNYSKDQKYREDFKNWIESIWDQKDKDIENLQF